MSIDRILQEASTVLSAASRYSTELSEVSKIEHALCRMRILITTVAAHTYSSFGKDANIAAEVDELQHVKNALLRIAEQRFGSTSHVLNEFQYVQKQMTGS
jgi:hypothetical protein